MLVLSIGLLTSCDMVSGEGDGADNAVYMGNANSSCVVSMVVSDAGGGSAVITPRLANLTSEPVEVTVALDEELLEEYSKEAGVSLLPVSADDFVFVTKDGKESHGKATVVIESGQYNASVEVKMPMVDADKYPYSKAFAIPVSITDASNYKVLSSPKSTIVRLNRQLVTSVARFTRGGSIVFLPKNDALREPMSEWTMQVTMLYPVFTNYNQTVMSIGGAAVGEFYTRITSTAGVQVKNGRDGDDTWTQKPLETNKWLQISFVHRNSSEVSVYINGELQKTFSTSPLYFSKDGDTSLYIGNEQYGGVYLREARMWNRALTEGEIIDKEYLPQDVSDPSLIMYAPFTKVADNGVEELTGNWEVSEGSSAQITYIENVLFPSEKLTIVE